MESDYSRIISSALKYVSGESRHVCRLCFASTVNDEVVLLDTATLDMEFINQTVTFELMLTVLGIDIEPPLPKTLCTNCSSLVINSYVFKRLCEYSNIKWMEALNKLEDSLHHKDLMKPDTNTAFIALNKPESNFYITAKKIKAPKDKAKVLSEFKTIKKYREHYAKIKIKNLKSARAAFPCQQCVLVFPNALGLRSHEEKVHNPKTIPCKQCPKMFSTMRILRSHIVQRHTETTCTLCSMKVPSKAAMRGHLKLHQGKIVCPKCNKSFKQKYSFQLHSRVCGNNEPREPAFICDFCGKNFANRQGVRNHLLRQHGSGAGITCQWCGKQFNVLSHLKLHIVKHTKEKNYCCTLCGGRFVTNAALVYHTRIHTGERPYPCDMCDKSFLSASRRMDHKRETHFAPTKECPVCDSKFTTKSHLLRHLRRHYKSESKLYVPNLPSLSKLIQKLS